MTTVVTKPSSPASCERQAYNRLSGAVRVVLTNSTIERDLRLEVLQRAFDDAERLAAGNDPLYVHDGQHSAPADSDCHDPPEWNAIPG